MKFHNLRVCTRMCDLFVQLYSQYICLVIFLWIIELFLLVHVNAYSQIRAFAKVALQGTEAIQNVDPGYKGYTLPQSGVEP